MNMQKKFGQKIWEKGSNMSEIEIPHICICLYEKDANVMTVNPNLEVLFMNCIMYYCTHVYSSVFHRRSRNFPVNVKINWEILAIFSDHLRKPELHFSNPILTLIILSFHIN